ncbi:DUF3048 domain-containing protein [Helicovermis profundi]|uniref:DUF3048 domain-containing protein n=1 Tax=Helicovermis profundi TaxID=3065157 RepID=A0AAU9EE16_9FIRM|nr:hypothetical protein HLPR_20050 [Clostridia bacterium S502]
MFRKIYLLLLIFVIVFASSACQNASSIDVKDNTSNDVNLEKDNKLDKDSSDKKNLKEVIVIEDKKTEKEEDTVQSEASKEKTSTDSEVKVSTKNSVDSNTSEKEKSKLSGLLFDKSELEKRPVAVMLDNQYYARPQSGLSEAEVVYEILAEGLITRYMAVFYGNAPKRVGPIRSARPYFINKALEYDPLYAHVGGSPAAWADLVNLNVADLDGLSGNGMYRTSKTNKKPPHNTYSSISALRKAGSNRKYRLKGNFDFFEFYSKDEKPINSEQANYLKIVYKKSSSSDKTGYYVEFKYDKDLKEYYRYVNGKHHIDEANGENLTAKNIIVQFAKHKVIDDKGRLKIDDLGKGDAYLLTMGVKTKLTWSKKNRESMTKFYDKDGKLIELNKGVTWFEVVPKTIKLGW